MQALEAVGAAYASFYLGQVRYNRGEEDKKEHPVAATSTNGKWLPPVPEVAWGSGGTILCDSVHSKWWWLHEST